jgi:tripartite-type tricarboxylate transporter receptor subunit TctC
MVARHHLLAAVVGSTCLLASFAELACAQGWPNRPVRMIVPFAAGGPTDFVGRLVADQLAKTWNQQVVIENRGGAGTNIGNEVVARSDPDGYTILFGTASMAVNRTLYRSLSYDPIVDFAPITHVSNFSLFMYVTNVLPVRSLQEFLAYAKANRGRITLASPGTGSTPHLAGELLKRMAGIEMTHVPYRGASPALNDLIPGRVDVYFGSGALLGNVRSGQVRGLATTGAKRDPAAPDLPTIAEAGVPGYEVSTWHGLFAPAKTPAAIIAKINADTVAVLADPAIRAKLEQGGYIAVGSGPDALAALLKSEIDKWGTVVTEAGIRID